MASDSFRPLTDAERNTADIFYMHTGDGEGLSSDNALTRRLYEHIQVLTERNQNLSRAFRDSERQNDEVRRFVAERLEPTVTNLLTGVRMSMTILSKVGHLHTPTEPGGNCPSCQVPSPCPTRSVLLEMVGDLHGLTSQLTDMVRDTDGEPGD